MNNADALKKFELFDSHFHIIDERYPLIANNGYLPDGFNCQNYLTAMASYRLIGGAVVSGSFQAFDQTYLIAALKDLGENFVGVTQLPNDVSDREILELHKARVRAARFNIRRGGSLDLSHLSSFAARVYELAGWHVELYIDSSTLVDIYSTLITLPAVSIDHLGLSQQGLACLLSLAEQGVRVKATGFSRVDFAVEPALKDLHSANPHALMFGTDMPSTRAPRAYAVEDFILVADTLGETAAQQVFSLNAQSFYKLKAVAAA
ncbi:MAG TPA: amidohydrolase family protein [Cellvibrionaceae bacterium]